MTEPIEPPVEPFDRSLLDPPDDQPDHEVEELPLGSGDDYAWARLWPQGGPAVWVWTGARWRFGYVKMRVTRTSGDVTVHVDVRAEYADEIPGRYSVYRWDPAVIRVAWPATREPIERRYR